MEAPLESQVNEIMSQPGVQGVLCADSQGLALVAQGSLKEDMAGVVSGLAEKAKKLKHSTEADDQPVTVVEIDSGNVLIRSQGQSSLAIHKI